MTRLTLATFKPNYMTAPALPSTLRISDHSLAIPLCLPAILCTPTHSGYYCQISARDYCRPPSLADGHCTLRTPSVGIEHCPPIVFSRVLWTTVYLDRKSVCFIIMTCTMQAGIMGVAWGLCWKSLLLFLREVCVLTQEYD